MKKVLSLLTAVLLFVSMFSFVGASAEAINYLPATEEDFDSIVAGTYTPSIRDTVGFPALAVWAGVPGYPSDDEFWASGTLSFDTENFKYGTKSIKVVSSKQATCITVPLLVPASYFEAGKTYTFQAYIKTNKVMATETGAGLLVGATDEDHGAYDEFIAVYDSMSGTKDWTLMALPFVAPAHKTAEGKDVILKFEMQCWTCINGTTWFDGLAVVEGDSPVIDYNSLVSVNGGSTDTPAEPTPAPVAPTLNGEPSAWAKEEILKALEADLVPEHVNSNYTTDITRSDFCDLIIKMIEKKSGKAIADVIAGYADAKADVSFPDTDSANVIAAAKLGIVNGRSSGAFDPSANITRQEAAKMLALAAKVLGADITASEVAFADADDIYAWAKEFIYYVNTIGVMNGTSTTTPPNFSPLRTYTREQSILTVYRLFNAL
ncbi:MAG: S-layer homology domain-containing protein [Ruminococcaceae bacterium]|nr:S-layer homology domain-containing protein [Oscillospiraceae bacterium]